MANNFYNINISKYNPAEHTVAGQSQLNSNPEQRDTLPTNQDAIKESPNVNENHSQHARLNALDSTILINESYQNIDDEVFKAEYQIDRLESQIRSIEQEIENAKAINDFQKVDILTMRKHAMQDRLSELCQKYGKSDVTTKLSSDIASVLRIKPNAATKMIDNAFEVVKAKVLPLISKKYNSGKNIKAALNKLETLNKNVDELVTMQMPYGEADERYDMLSEYLNRANVIHFNISKTVGTPTFFDTISSIDQQKFSEARKNSSNFGNMATRPNKNKMSPDNL